jgi:hypothetical protein
VKNRIRIRIKSIWICNTVCKNTSGNILMLHSPQAGNALKRGLRLGCAGFAKKIFSLQSETKRNEIRFACVSHAHVKKKNFRFFSLHFASNFSLPIKAKLIERIFALFRFQNFFRFALFRFRSFRFASMRNKINVFSLCFRFFHFRFASDA